MRQKIRLLGIGAIAVAVCCISSPWPAVALQLPMPG